METPREEASNEDSSVVFTLNGKLQKVKDLPPSTSLLSFIRNHAQLKGTKFMCREGGCGSCIVNLTGTHPVSRQQQSISVNSCLYPLYSCHGMSVTTVEGIGSKQKGHHPVQQRLAHFYGSQCGYCSPGWVMAMYSLLKSKPVMTMREIEESLGSNICRCTGYRPILDAFKSFAIDAPPDLKQKIADIEDLHKPWPEGNSFCKRKCSMCPERPEVSEDENEDFEQAFVEVALSPPNLCISLTDGSTWYRVSSVKEIFEIFDMVTGTYMLVGGNTAQGVFEFKYPQPPDVYIDVSGVKELHSNWFNRGFLYLGGNMTLTDTLNLFEKVAQDKPTTFSYLSVLAKHINKIAHIPVRNVGTIAGSLSTKHTKKDFESDIFTIFETVGALLTIVSASSMTQQVSLPEYLQLDMYKKVITQIIFPPLDNRYYLLRTYKISKIVQNSHAYVNAGFLFKMDRNYKILDRPRIVYGGIASDFIHAERTESYLKDKQLLNNTVIQGALVSLDQEVKPVRDLPQASNAYRKGLTLSLFYKFVLGVNPLLVAARYRSGGEDIDRPLTSGRQEFATDPSLYPVNQPLPKLEALIQCSGEAEYNYDLSESETDLFAAFVISDRGPAVLAGVYPNNALAIKGVVAFFSAKDIPGENKTAVLTDLFYLEPEKLFADSEVEYAGQVVGMIVAHSQEVADFAASRVVIKYAAERKPKLTAQEVLSSGDASKIKKQASIDPKKVKTDIKHVLKGTYQNPGQYHYSMETQTCLVRPSVDGLEVHVSSHDLQFVQEGISRVLAIPTNRIDMKVQRVGGSYGGKIARPNYVGCACALAAYLLKVPVRTILTMETNMHAIGIRKPTYYEYEVSIDENGVIQELIGNHYDIVGVRANEIQYVNSVPGLKSVYDADTWNVGFYDVRTDQTTNAWMRAPGTFTAYASTENLMEHISKVAGLDPVTVRLNNLKPDSNVKEALEEMMKKVDYDTRLNNCKMFNAANVWKKRGISVLPMQYDLGFEGNLYAVISIYRQDGTVALTHGGIDIGQGIHTQAAQTCARELGIPLHYVQVKESSNFTSPNTVSTGGSVTGDTVVYAVIKCCEILNERLAPVKKKLINPTWEQIIRQAYMDNVNLNAVYMFNVVKDAKIYTVSGVAVSEVEIDCLTGEHKVVRVDVMVDGGQSVNPFIDIGQAEGAFVQGQGYFTSEDLIYDTSTGDLRVNRSWDYKVPQVKDIPIDFRIYLKKNSVNTIGPTRAKALGEPPILLSFTVLSALRRAIESLRIDVGFPDDFFSFEPPATAEKIFLTCSTPFQKYVI